MITLDVETLPISASRPLPPIVAAGVGGGGVVSLMRGAEFREVLPALLASEEMIANHAIGFDLGSAATHWPETRSAIEASYRAGRIRCTRVRDDLEGIRTAGYPRHGRSLERVAAHHELEGATWTPEEESWQCRYGELEDVPPEQWPAAARSYLERDVRTAYELATRGTPEIDEERQARYDYALRMSSALGIEVDSERAAALADGWRAQHAELRAALRSVGIIRSDGSRDMAALQARAASAGVTRRTPKGRLLQTDADTLLGTDDPILHAAAAYQQLDHHLSTDVPILERGVVCTEYGLAGSGRSTSSKPNMQNQPRKGGMRECFRSRTGRFCIIDYPTLELRTLSQVAGPGPLRDRLIAGADLHIAMASRIFPGQPDGRQAAKAVNFGLPGLMGINALRSYARDSYGVVMSEDQAMRAKRAWTEENPEVVRLQRQIMAYADAGRHIDHYRSGRLRYPVTASSACNSVMQGLAADATKSTLAALIDERMRVVAYIHDEYLIEIETEQEADHALEVIRSVWGEWCPDVPIGPIEYRIAERWEKG